MRADIAGVILTHLHFDHAGALVDLPSATTVWVHATELAAAKEAGERSGYHPSLLAAPVAWQLYRGDTTPLDGVLLIETPGHTLGHVSVIVQVGTTQLLLTGDAAPTGRSLRERLLPGLHVDTAAAARSLERLIQVWREGAIPLPSHDPQFWADQPADIVRFEIQRSTL